MSRLVLLALLAGCSHGSVNAEQTPVDGGIGHHPDAPRIIHDAPASSARFLCRETPPVGAPMPLPPPLPTAGCPALARGMNTITTTGKTRQFILVVPAQVDVAETLPVLFMWHWIGGTAQGFLERGEVQAAADDQHFLAVLPVSEGASVLGTSFNTKWPFDITQSTDRMNEEFRFFDDMLACTEQQIAVNRS